MYCPNCAAAIDGVKFCRACGANVSLVSQAMTGELQSDASNLIGDRKGHRAPSLERAAKSFFSGIGFIFVSFAVMFYAPAGRLWWFWLLIPAFAMMGEGVAQYIRIRELRRREDFTGQLPGSPSSLQMNPPPSAPPTSQIPSSPSITEHTTKNLSK